MTPSLVLLCITGLAVVAFATSALLGLGVVTLRRRLEAFTAAAQSRLLLSVAVLPALVSIAVMTAALAPSFGWIVDHCASSPDSHAHPHLCAAHHVANLPAISSL